MGPQFTIHLQTYNLTADETGKLWCRSVQPACRGEKSDRLYSYLDGYASQHLSSQLIEEWKTAGIHFRWFWPLFKSRHFYLGRRMHHKVKS